MDPRTKIATCCYCGSRTLLTLGGSKERHELACSNCSAPLHELKQIKTPSKPVRSDEHRHRKPDRDRKSKSKAPKYSKPRKKEHRPTFARFAKKLFDEIEDIFD